MPWRYLDETVAANHHGPRVRDPFNIVIIVNKLLYDAFLGGSRDILVFQQMAELCLKSSVFTYQVIVGDSYGADTRDENGTWQGQTGMLRDGLGDIAVPTMVMDYEKLNDISYMSYYEYMDVRILSTKRVKKDVEDVLTPFAGTDMRIWIFLAFAVIAAAFISFLLEKPLGYLKHSTIGNYLILYFSYMLYQGGVCRSTSMSCRILITIMGFAGMLVVCLFYADFKTSLIIEKELDVINTVQDIAKRKNVYPMMSNAVGVLGRVLQETNDDEKLLAKRYRILFEKLLKLGVINDRGYAVHCFGEKFFHLVEKGEIVGVDSRLALGNCLRDWCEKKPTWPYHMSKDPLETVLLACPRRKTLEPWILKRMEKRGKAIVESGFTERFKQYLEGNEEYCLRKRSLVVPEEEPDTTVKVEALASPFYFLFIGTSLSFVVFLGELLYHHISHKSSPTVSVSRSR